MQLTSLQNVMTWPAGRDSTQGCYGWIHNFKKDSSLQQLFHKTFLSLRNEISTKKVRNGASKCSKCLLFVEASYSFVHRYCLSTVPEVYTNGIDCRSAPENLLSNMLSTQPVKLKESQRLPLLWSSLIRQYSAESLTINLKSCFSPTVSGRGIF